MKKKDFALLGASGSGKTALALEIAKKYDYIILSLDSLSLYKEIDIASLKPSGKELDMVKHFGVNEIYPNQPFNVVKFFDFYKKAKQYGEKKEKGVMIVGGSSFYLKMLLTGISNTPILDNFMKEKVQHCLLDLENAYNFLKEKDPLFAKKINKNDKYRIEKALEIIFSTSQIPSVWFKENKKKPLLEEIKIFSISTEKEELKKRILKRTDTMFHQGIIDEAAFLERKYSLACSPLSSIGLNECYQYLNGKIAYEKCKELVSTHTYQLAKRQETFNKGQFADITYKSTLDLKETIKRYIFC